MTYAKNDHTQVSPHFNVSEFKCKCHYPACDETKIDTRLVDTLEKIRRIIGKPLHLNCGYRCVQHNQDVKGSTFSQHILGKAADISARGIGVEELAKVAAQVLGNTGGIGKYHSKNFVHVDVRIKPSRWNRP